MGRFVQPLDPLELAMKRYFAVNSTLFVPAGCMLNPDVGTCTNNSTLRSHRHERQEAPPVMRLIKRQITIINIIMIMWSSK